MAINNESIGISAEVAIAQTFGVTINPQYVARAEQEIVNLLLRGGCVRQILTVGGYLIRWNMWRRVAARWILNWLAAKRFR